MYLLKNFFFPPVSCYIFPFLNITNDDIRFFNFLKIQLILTIHLIVKKLYIHCKIFIIFTEPFIKDFKNVLALLEIWININYFIELIFLNLSIN